MNAKQRRTLDEIARDLDLLVFRLEHQEREARAATDTDDPATARLRKELERLRDRLQDVVDDLW